MKKSTKQGIEVGVSAAAAAAVVGLATYLFSGKEGAKRKKKTEAWLLKAKREIIKEVGSAKKLSEPYYSQIVDHVLEKHQELGKVNAADIARASRELKAAWKKIQARSSAAPRKAVKKSAGKKKKRPAKKR